MVHQASPRIPRSTYRGGSGGPCNALAVSRGIGHLGARENPMAKVFIKRVGGKVVFDPPNLILGSNDFVSWTNEDSTPGTEGSHWPKPVGGPDNAFIPRALAPGGDISRDLAMGARGAATQEIPYDCAVHPGEVSGKLTIPMAASIAISAGAPATYTPATLTILMPSNDTVTFTNNDTANAHQPFPKGQSPTTWMAAPIPAKGKTASSAKFPAPARTNQDQSITYNCAVHPDSGPDSGEEGVILIPKL